MKQNIFIKILNSLLVALGFSTFFSCCMYGTPTPDYPCMYGTPNMDFKVSGKVTDDNSNPIAGIKVSYEGKDGIVEIYSAKDGSFTAEGNGMSARLRLEDVDGPENGGEFVTKEELVKVEKVSDGNGWYKGRFEAENVTIVLDKK